MFFKAIAVLALPLLAVANPISARNAQCSDTMMCCNGSNSCSTFVSSSTCDGSPMCCQGNNFNGMIVIGCTPITANVL